MPRDVAQFRLTQHKIEQSVARFKAELAEGRRVENMEAEWRSRFGAKEAELREQAKRIVQREANEQAHRERMASLRAVRTKRAPGFYTQSDIDAIIRRQNGKCAAPRCDADVSKRGPHRHVNHKTPIALGGSNWPNNLQVLCAFCNMSKGSLDYHAWLARVST